MEKQKSDHLIANDDSMGVIGSGISKFNNN